MVHSFDEIYGNRDIKDFLYRKALSGEGGTFLLCGEKGLGKKAMANAYVQILLENDKPHMANVQKLLESGNHPDVVFVKAEKAFVSVDDVRRKINDDIKLRPAIGSKKIYIIEDAEKMTVQAQNALLKTIEEPAEYAVFFLLAQSAEALLPTIRSRCTILKLKPLAEDEMEAFEAGIGEKNAHAEAVRPFAGGNPGKLKSILDDEAAFMFYENMHDFLRHIAERDAAELAEEFELLTEDGKKTSECLCCLRLWYRDVLVCKVTNDANRLIFSGDYGCLKILGEKQNLEEINGILDGIDKAEARLAANVNRQTVLWLLFLTVKEV